MISSIIIGTGIWSSAMALLEKMNYKEKPKRKYHRNPDSARSKDDSTGKSSDKTR